MTKVPLFDLRVSGTALRESIDQAFTMQMDSALFVGGEPVRRFEEEFARYCGGGSCVGVANGTDALILSLRALGIGPGDEVIAPPFTFVATAEAIAAVGAKIQFVDVHPKNYNLDVTLLEKKVTPKTKAILVVHLFGQPADMDPILNLAEKKKLKVIEDAAQAHGAKYKGQRVGTLGDVGCFSFYPTKNLGGFGDGGAVVSKSSDLIQKIRQLADHGRKEGYIHEVVGVNSRLDALQASVLRLKLKNLDQENQRRRKIAETYQKALLGHSYITPSVIEPYAEHVFHLFCLESSYRDQVLQHLRDVGIACGVYYPLSLHLQPAFAHLNHTLGDFPVSERASDRIFSVPVQPKLTNEQVKFVCDQLKSFQPSAVPQ